MDDSKKSGQGLLVLCEARKAELDAALAHLAKGDPSPVQNDIQAALDALAGMLTGDLDHPSSAVTEGLSKWLALHKHLALKEQRELAALGQVAAAPAKAVEPVKPSSAEPPRPA